jgi:hypothetical protein
MKLFENIEDEIASYSFSLYLSACVLTVYTSCLALHYGIGLSVGICLPLLIAVFGLLFAVAGVLKHLILDVISNLSYRERFAVFLLYGVFFVMPIFIFHGPNLLLSFVFLLLPLAFFCQKQQNFNRLYFVNALVLATTIMSYPRSSPVVVFVFVILLIVTLLFDYVAAKEEKFRTALPIQWADILRILSFYAVLVIGLGGAFYVLTPPLTPHVYVSSQQEYASREVSLETLSQETLVKLLIYTVVLIILLFVLLAVLNWISKKFRKRTVTPIEVVKSSLSVLKKAVQETFFRKIKMQFSSPRDAIVFYYAIFCERLAQAGFARKSDWTPREYAAHLRTNVPISADPEAMLFGSLDFLTTTFERAIYSPLSIAPDDSERFKRSLDALSTVLKSWQHP